MFVRGTIIFLLALLTSTHFAAAQAPVSGPVDSQLIEDLVSANRILADQGCLALTAMSASAIPPIQIAT
jgi:hypothetical protein